MRTNPCEGSYRREEGTMDALMTKQNLMKIKARALRTRVWFRVLSKVERAIVDLTIKCVERIKSQILMETICGIISKILQAHQLKFLARAESVGRQIAEQLSIIAERWGNKSCSSWKHDLSFVRLLGINTIYSSV